MVSSSPAENSIARRQEVLLPQGERAVTKKCTTLCRNNKKVHFRSVSRKNGETEVGEADGIRYRRDLNNAIDTTMCSFDGWPVHRPQKAAFHGRYFFSRARDVSIFWINYIQNKKKTSSYTTKGGRAGGREGGREGGKEVGREGALLVFREAKILVSTYQRTAIARDFQLSISKLRTAQDKHTGTTRGQRRTHATAGVHPFFNESNNLLRRSAPRPKFDSREKI